MPNRAHHSGRYHAQAKAVRAAANADPTTRCWACGRTLAEHPPHRNGSPARWTAGHVNDGQVGGPLLPEASTCNFSRGARMGNARRRMANLNTSREW